MTRPLFIDLNNVTVAATMATLRPGAFKTADAIRTSYLGATAAIRAVVASIGRCREVHGVVGPIIACSDHTPPKFRFEECPAYKGNRAAMAEKRSADENAYIKRQIVGVRKFLRAAGVVVMRHEGFEADDWIAMLCRVAKDIRIGSTIVSGDKDFWQLVSPAPVDIDVICARTGKQYTDAVVRAKLGIPVPAVGFYKAMIGDSSDNVSGLGKIGEKRAVAAIQASGIFNAPVSSAFNVVDDFVKWAKRHAAEVKGCGPLADRLDNDGVKTLRRNLSVLSLQDVGYPNRLGTSVLRVRADVYAKLSRARRDEAELTRLCKKYRMASLMYDADLHTTLTEAMQCQFTTTTTSSTRPKKSSSTQS